MVFRTRDTQIKHPIRKLGQSVQIGSEQRCTLKPESCSFFDWTDCSDWTRALIIYAVLGYVISPSIIVPSSPLSEYQNMWLLVT
jgi:hypothetical protein